MVDGAVVVGVSVVVCTGFCVVDGKVFVVTGGSDTVDGVVALSVDSWVVVAGISIGSLHITMNS